MSKRHRYKQKMEEIREILQTVAQRTLATTSAAEAVKEAVEDKKSSTTDGSKLIAKPNIFDCKSQEEEIKAFRESSRVSEKHLGAVDEGYLKDLKEIHDKPDENFDWDSATSEEKTRCIKLYGLLASLLRGRALHLVKAGDSNGLDASRSLNKALNRRQEA